MKNFDLILAYFFVFLASFIWISPDLTGSYWALYLAQSALIPVLGGRILEPYIFRQIDRAGLRSGGEKTNWSFFSKEGRRKVDHLQVVYHSFLIIFAFISPILFRDLLEGLTGEAYAIMAISGGVVLSLVFGMLGASLNRLWSVTS